MTKLVPRSSTPSTSAPSAARLRFGDYAFPPLLGQRLAAEHGWSPDHTDRVLGEYRRFLQLAAFSGQSVTPSRMVDAAWHEHLTLTRDYWERLCGEVLGQPVHHEPQAGGGEADPAPYLSTLDLYARTFGEAPPAQIWPDPRLPRPAEMATPRLAGAAHLRFLVVMALAVGGFLLWHTGGLIAGLLLGLAVLLRAVKWQPGQARSNTGGGTDGAAWMFAGLSLGDSSSGSDGGSTGSDGGCSDGGGGSDGGSSCGSSCGSGCSSS